MYIYIYIRYIKLYKWTFKNYHVNRYTKLKMSLECNPFFFYLQVKISFPKINLPPHSSQVSGPSLNSGFCLHSVSLHVLPGPMWVSSSISSLPQIFQRHTNMLILSKLPLGVEWSIKQLLEMNENLFFFVRQLMIHVGVFYFTLHPFQTKGFINVQSDSIDYLGRTFW